MNLDQTHLLSFKNFIWSFYHEQGRTFAWRNVDNPYYVLVSEIMLQQTQTYRVQPKYEQFITEFPTIQSLADASLRDVLAVWQGLGYNRRGKALHDSARKVCQEFDGKLPEVPEVLQTFPGIGPATAASICAFAFNKPTVFIETNIRTVFIHSFFKDRDLVHDKEIMPLVAATVPQDNPREWYYALMDYGVYLKKQSVNPSRKSVHHTKQSKFEGSDRQVRGMIIKLLTHHHGMTEQKIVNETCKESARVAKILEQLCHERLIVKANSHEYKII